MELDLSHDPVHATGFFAQNICALQLDVMAQIYAVFFCG
jgi:hypothetical protein